MLSEEKIKLMTQLALYESGQGKKDLEISRFNLRQYQYMEMAKAGLASISGFLLLLILLFLLFFNRVIDLIKTQSFYKYGIAFFLIVLFGTIAQMIYARNDAKKRYEEAVPRVREYKKNVTKLYYFYEIQETSDTMQQEGLKETIEEGLDEQTIDF